MASSYKYGGQRPRPSGRRGVTAAWHLASEYAAILFLLLATLEKTVGPLSLSLSSSLHSRAGRVWLGDDGVASSPLSVPLYEVLLTGKG